MPTDDSNDTGTKTSTDTGDKTDSASGQQKDERVSWTPDDWQREIDRRVNEAVKKHRDDMKGALAAKDRDAETVRTELLASVERAEQKAAFADLAIKAGLKDIAGGYAIATTLGYFDGKNLKLDEMRTAHPGLFASGVASNHGAGEGTTSKAPMDFNTAIRRAAGKL
jgi:hypothetical protein